MLLCISCHKQLAVLCVNCLSYKDSSSQTNLFKTWESLGRSICSLLMAPDAIALTLRAIIAEAINYNRAYTSTYSIGKMLSWRIKECCIAYLSSKLISDRRLGTLKNHQVDFPKKKKKKWFLVINDLIIDMNCRQSVTYWRVLEKELTSVRVTRSLLFQRLMVSNI